MFLVTFVKHGKVIYYKMQSRNERLLQEDVQRSLQTHAASGSTQHRKHSQSTHLSKDTSTFKCPPRETDASLPLNWQDC